MRLSVLVLSLIFAAFLQTGCSENVPEFLKLGASRSSDFLKISSSSTASIKSLANEISIEGECLLGFSDLEIRGGGLDWVSVDLMDGSADLDCTDDQHIRFDIGSLYAGQIFSSLVSETIQLQFRVIVDSKKGDGSVSWSVDFAPEEVSLTPELASGQSKGSSYNPGSGFIEIEGSTNKNSVDKLGVDTTGLIGYWKFDEAAASEVQASVKDSHNSFDGTLVTFEGSTVKSVAGQLEGGLYFDGIDDSVSIAANSGLTLTDQITLMAWVKPKWCCDFGGSRIISQKVVGGGADTFALLIHDSGGPGPNVIEFRFRDSSAADFYLESDTEITLDRWQHVVATYDGSTMKIFVNGREDKNFISISTTIEINSTNGLRFGERESEGRRFNGELDELSFWSRALTQAEITEIYNKQAAAFDGYYISEVLDGGALRDWNRLSWETTHPVGKRLPVSSEVGYQSGNMNMVDLVFLASFEEESLGTVGPGGFDFKDRSTYMRHGVAEGGVGLGKSSRFGNSLEFDGVDDCVSLGHFSVSGVGFSAAAWIYPMADKGDHRRILSKSISGVPDTHSFMLSTYPFGSDGMGLRARYKVGSSTSSGTATLHPTQANIRMNEWNHVAMTHDGSTLKTYVNGSLEDQMGHVGSVDPLPHEVTVGCSPDRVSWSFFEGKIDEVAIWNRALSATEMLDLYRRGSSKVGIQIRSCQDTSCSDDPPFVGPDGSEATQFSEALNETTGLPSIDFGGLLPASRYIQYQLDLRSFDSSDEPLIKGVTLQGSPR